MEEASEESNHFHCIPKKESFDKKFWYINAGMLPFHLYQKAVIAISTDNLNMSDLSFVMFIGVKYLIHYIELYTFDPTPLMTQCVERHLKYMQLLIGKQKSANKLLSYNFIIQTQTIFNKLNEVEITNHLFRQMYIDQLERLCNMFNSRLIFWMKSAKLQAYLYRFGYDPYRSAAIYNSFLIPNEKRYITPMTEFDQRFIEKIELRCHCKILLTEESMECHQVGTYMTLEVVFDFYNGNYVGFLDMLSYIVKQLNPTMFFAKSLRTILIEGAALYNILTNVPVKKLRYLEKNIIAGLPVTPFLDSISVSKQLFSIVATLHEEERNMVQSSRADSEEVDGESIKHYETIATDDEFRDIQSYRNLVKYSNDLLKFFEKKYAMTIEKMQPNTIGNSPRERNKSSEKKLSDNGFSKTHVSKSTKEKLNEDCNHFEVSRGSTSSSKSITGAIQTYLKDQNENKKSSNMKTENENYDDKTFTNKQDDEKEERILGSNVEVNDNRTQSKISISRISGNKRTLSKTTESKRTLSKTSEYKSNILRNEGSVIEEPNVSKNEDKSKEESNKYSNKEDEVRDDGNEEENKEESKYEEAKEESKEEVTTKYEEAIEESKQDVTEINDNDGTENMNDNHNRNNIEDSINLSDYADLNLEDQFKAILKESLNTYPSKTQWINHKMRLMIRCATETTKQDEQYPFVYQQRTIRDRLWRPQQFIEQPYPKPTEFKIVPRTSQNINMKMYNNFRNDWMSKLAMRMLNSTFNKSQRLISHDKDCDKEYDEFIKHNKPLSDHLEEITDCKGSTKTFIKANLNKSPEWIHLLRSNFVCPKVKKVLEEDERGYMEIFDQYKFDKTLTFNKNVNETYFNILILLCFLKTSDLTNSEINALNNGRGVEFEFTKKLNKVQIINASLYGLFSKPYEMGVVNDLSTSISQIMHDMYSFLFHGKKQMAFYVEHLQLFSKIINNSSDSIRAMFNRLQIMKKLINIRSDLMKSQDYVDGKILLHIIDELDLLHKCLYSTSASFHKVASIGTIRVIYHSIKLENQLNMLEPFLRLPGDVRLSEIEESCHCLIALRNKHHSLLQINEYAVEIFYDLELGDFYKSMSLLKKSLKQIGPMKHHRSLVLYPNGEMWIFTDLIHLGEVFTTKFNEISHELLSQMSLKLNLSNISTSE